MLARGGLKSEVVEVAEQIEAELEVLLLGEFEGLEEGRVELRHAVGKQLVRPGLPVRLVFEVVEIRGGVESVTGYAPISSDFLGAVN